MYVHVVWTTRDRVPQLNARSAEFLSCYLPQVMEKEDATCIGLGIVSTHVHVLMAIRPTTQLPRLLQRLKGGSAHLARVQVGCTIKWAKGYSISTVGERALEAAHRYVCNQHVRHPGEAIPDWPTSR